jgi:hypothetical protein
MNSIAVCGCIKAGVPCTRPVPSPRRPRRGKSCESEMRGKGLLERIGKLEDVVEGLKRGREGCED